MRLNLLLAAGITVFVTVLVAAIVQHMVARPSLANDTTPLPTATLFVPTVAPQATPRPVVDAEAVQQREATFQARLAAANDAIASSAAELAAAKQAQAELTSKYNALAQQQQRQAPLQVMVTATPAVVAQTQASTDAPVYASMDAVLATLQSQNPAAVLLQQPEMVMYENNVAYEFVFDMGTVYVTASDGALLYDGIAMNARAVADTGRRNPPPGRRGDGDHHRHNDDGDDEDEDEHAETHETEDEHEDEGGDDD